METIDFDFLIRGRQAKEKNASNVTISGQLKEQTGTVRYCNILHDTTLQVIPHKTSEDQTLSPRAVIVSLELSTTTSCCTSFSLISQPTNSASSSVMD